MKTRLTVDGFHFESAHNLYNYDGKCKNLHGHSYKLSVTVEGQVDKNGFIIDFGKIKELVYERVISRYDHQYLNKLVNYNPTAENLAQRIAHDLANAFTLHCDGVRLVSVRLWETENCMVEVEL